MLIEDLLVWILVCYGITNVVTGSTMCFGFWAGLLVSLVWASPTGLGEPAFLGPEWYHHILDGFLASGTCWLFHTYEQSTM